MDPIVTPDWQEESNCVGTDLDSWYENDKKTHVVLAKICANCPVIAQCYDAALESGEAWGYRAGLWFGPNYNADGSDGDTLDSRTMGSLVEFVRRNPQDRIAA